MIKKALTLVAVFSLLAMFSLCVGCDKKNKDKENSGSATTVTSTIEGMPNEAVGEVSDGKGGTVYVEDIITEDDLDDPENYNENQEETVSANSTTSATNGDTNATSTVSEVSSNSSTDLTDTQDTDDGYNQGWWS